MYKTGSEILDVPPSGPSPKKQIGSPKTSKFRYDFGQLRALNANWTEQDVVDRTTA